MIYCLWIRSEKTWVIVLFYHLLSMCPWASVLNSLYLGFIIYKVWKIISAYTPHKALEGENETTYVEFIWKYVCYANLCFFFVVVILKRQLVKKKSSENGAIKSDILCLHELK